MRQGRTLAGRSFWDRIHMTEVINRPLNSVRFIMINTNTWHARTGAKRVVLFIRTLVVNSHKPAERGTKHKGW